MFCLFSKGHIRLRFCVECSYPKKLPKREGKLTYSSGNLKFVCFSFVLAFSTVYYFAYSNISPHFDYNEKHTFHICIINIMQKCKWYNTHTRARAHHIGKFHGESRKRSFDRILRTARTHGETLINNSWRLTQKTERVSVLECGPVHCRKWVNFRTVSEAGKWSWSCKWS